MGTMMALRAHARGGPEQLVYEQAPAPSAGPGEALVGVHAAAITFAELTVPTTAMPCRNNKAAIVRRAHRHWSRSVTKL